MAKFLDKKEVANLLKISVRSIDTLRKKNGLPFHLIGVQVRFIESEVLRWAGVAQSDFDGTFTSKAIDAE